MRMSRVLLPFLCEQDTMVYSLSHCNKRKYLFRTAHHLLWFARGFAVGCAACGYTSHSKTNLAVGGGIGVRHLVSYKRKPYESWRYYMQIGIGLPGTIPGVGKTYFGLGKKGRPWSLF